MGTEVRGLDIIPTANLCHRNECVIPGVSPMGAMRRQLLTGSSSFKVWLWVRPFIFLSLFFLICGVDRVHAG